jgi:hypothetical protein
LFQRQVELDNADLELFNGSVHDGAVPASPLSRNWRSCS